MQTTIEQPSTQAHRMTESEPTRPSSWYVIHTLSGREAKVKAHLETHIKIEELQGDVFEILMPTETVSEVKNGKKTTKVRKLYPGYLFINMNLYNESGDLLQKPWNFVRDTDGVIGLVGGERPVPLQPAEIKNILEKVKEAEGKEVPKVKFVVGDQVRLTAGPFANFTGTIEEIDLAEGKLKVSVFCFGRFTPVDLEFWQVEAEEG